MGRGAANSEFSRVAERNIEALLKRRKLLEKKKGWQNRLADRITAFTGSMLSIYFHLVLFGVWIIWNLPLFPSLPKFDPTYVILAMFASVEAIFLSTFILITQNRMAEIDDRRAELDLQISLLSEHEITRLLSLVIEMSKKMGIDKAHEPDLSELEKDVPPEDVLDKIEEARSEDSREESIL